MLFMVIENFKYRDAAGIRDRVHSRGRLLPEGVAYYASWIDPASGRCFQIMEAPHTDLLTTWINRWSDLIDFEVVPVVTSSDYWSNPRFTV